VRTTGRIDGVVGAPGASRHIGTATWQVRGQKRRLTVASSVALLLLCGLLASAAQATRSVRRSASFLLDPAAQRGPLQAPVRAPTTAAQSGPSDVETIRFFSSSFTYNGTTYPYQNVGTDPAHPLITFVRAVVVPIDLTFENAIGVDPHLNGSDFTGRVLASPVFVPTKFAVTKDFTQYADAFQRAEYWNVGGKRPSFHTLLVPRAVAPVRLTVPAADGVAEQLGNGIPLGFLSFAWLEEHEQGLLASLHISPHEFPIFITHNALAEGALGNHEALTVTQPNGRTAIYTYAFATWLDAGAAVPFGFSESFANDVTALGHEVAEWMNDPFITSAAPPWQWSVPPILPKACSNVIEVGDGLQQFNTVSVPQFGFTYHLQDLAFFSWFARQTPSEGFAGRYTFLGTTFTSPSTPCS
jgi:hypothetical protein